MARKSRSYTAKTADLIAYDDVLGRIEELKAESGWQDDDHSTAEEKFEAFYDSSLVVIGSEGKSDDELEEAQGVIEVLTEMAPGFEDSPSKVKELMKYCHRQAMYDTFAEPVERHIQDLMNGENLSEATQAFNDAIQGFGQSVFDDMKELDESQSHLSQRWNENQDEVRKAFDAANEASKNVQDQLKKIDLGRLRESAVSKMAEFAEAGGDAASTAKTSAVKALTFWKKKPKSVKFDDLFEEASELVDNFSTIRADMRITEQVMEKIVEEKLNPMRQNAQAQQTQQLEIIRKFDYQIEAGKELVRIFEEDVLPEVEKAEQMGEELDPMQQEGLREVRKGYKDFVERLSLLSSQKQEAAARTQALKINVSRFEKLVTEANTYNNATSISMKNTMNTLQNSLDALDQSIQSAKTNNMANDMFENLVRVVELGQAIQSKTSASVDPEVILAVRKSLNEISRQSAVEGRLAIENRKANMKLLEAVDHFAEQGEKLNHDTSDEALAKFKDAERAVEKAEKDVEDAEKSNRNKLKQLESKPASSGDDQTKKGKFNPAAKKTDASESDQPAASNDDESKPSAASKFKRKPGAPGAK